MAHLERANAYSALFGAVVGTLASIAVGAFIIGRQWERWVEIRDAHIAGTVINESINLSGFVTNASFQTAFSRIGSGPTITPNQGGSISTLCEEGYTMVGVRYTVASGNNAGALYHGIYPVCRKLIR